MRITVLTVPDCPNTPVVRERIAEALGLDGADAHVSSVEVSFVEVTTQEQARELGMAGSPTVLVDGRDPFASPGSAAAQPSVSCRLYRSAGGAVEGAPTVAALRAALRAALEADR